MADEEVLVRLHDVSKDYHSLRPLRVEQLTLAAGDAVALPRPSIPV